MPAIKKTAGRSKARPRASQKARFERADRAIGRVAKSLETAQKDLAAIGGSLGTGAGDVRKDVARLLRDASRDVSKMSKAVRRDLERLQKDVAKASKPKKAARGRAKTASRAKATKAKTTRAKSSRAKSTRAKSPAGKTSRAKSARSKSRRAA